MMTKKGFTIIELMIVVVIIAILAMAAVPIYSSYIQRARNSSVQHLLQQLALAEASTQAEVESFVDFVFIAASSDVTKLEKLINFGFRPDPSVGFVVAPSKHKSPGFVIFAVHRAMNSMVHVYDDVRFAGVRAYKPGEIYGADIPSEFPAFLMTGDSVNRVTPNGTIGIDIATGLVTGYSP